jgi:cytochrome c oxidase subunit 1
MYMALAYDLWPQLTRCAPLSRGPVRLQLWLWFVGMLVLSLPWHWVGLLGMPRRMAYYDYTHPALQPQAWTVTASTFGGLLLVVSAFLFVFILARHRRGDAVVAPYTFSTPAHPVGRAPLALNGLGLWVAMMIGLTLVNYAYPIAQLALVKEASVPVVPIGSR